MINDYENFLIGLFLVFDGLLGPALQMPPNNTVNIIF